MRTSMSILLLTGDDQPAVKVRSRGKSYFCSDSEETPTREASQYRQLLSK